MPPASKTRSPRRRGASAWRLASWAYFALSVELLAIVAAGSGRAPSWLLADRPWGVGAMSLYAIGLVLLAALLALAGGLRTALRAAPALAALGVGHAAIVALAPPRPLLAWLATDDIVFFLPTKAPIFALTIDDGLDPRTTPMLLETLREHGAHATFFVLGRSLEAQPALAERVVAEGHELANHQWDSRPALWQGPVEISASLQNTARALEPWGGGRWVRPGGGAPTAGVRQAACALGARIALADIFPFDSHIPWATWSAVYVEARTNPGSIVALHDVGARGVRTDAALRRALPALRKRGLRAVTLGELASQATNGAD